MKKKRIINKTTLSISNKDKSKDITTSLLGPGGSIEMIKVVLDAGADAVSLTNTFTGMVVDVENCTPVLANVTGGLSGPAIRPISLRMVWETVQRVSIPVIGIGGITDSDSALQYIIAGASAIQTGTALFGAGV